MYNNWADYARAGTTSNAIVLSANMFSGAGLFSYAKVRVLPKSQFYDASCPSTTSFLDFVDLRHEDGTKASSVVPAHNFGNRRHDYLVSFRSLAGDSLTLWRLDTPTPLTAPLSRETRSIHPYELPPDASQPGTTTRLETGDARALNAVYRGRYVWAAHSEQCYGSTTTDCAYTVRIDTTTGGWYAQGVGGPPPDTSYYQPAVMVAPTGRWVVAFHGSGTTMFAGAEFAAHAGSAGPYMGTLREGEACFARPSSSGTNAWGLNTGIALDPSDGTFWTVGAFAKGTSADCRRNGWSTQVSQIRW